MTATAQPIHRALLHTYEAQVKKAFQPLQLFAGPNEFSLLNGIESLKLCTHFLPRFHYFISGAKSFPLDHTLSFPRVF